MARPQLWDRGKERTWRQRVARWRHSGLTARDFCAREGLSEPSFYAWRRTLRERDQQCGRARQAKHGGTPPRVQPETPALVPVRLLPAATAVVDAGWAIEVVLAGGSVLRLRPGFDADSVRQLVALLQP